MTHLLIYWWAVRTWLERMADERGRVLDGYWLAALAAAGLHGLLVLVVGLAAGPHSHLFIALAGMLAGSAVGSALVVFGVLAWRARRRERG